MRRAAMKTPRTRTSIRAVLVLGLGLAAACAPRDAAMRAAPDPAGRIQPVYVATTRPLDRIGPSFGEARSTGLNYFRADISVPPTHVPGKVEWPDETPDARTDFVVTDTAVYRDARAMARNLQRRTPGQETLVFIHGFNNTLSDAMYRLAQIRADFDDGEAALLFSWPSAGDPRGYVYDRDSVLFARDDLEHVLKTLTAAQGERLVLVGHSMGSHLVMEVMRQAALRGDRYLLNRINAVVLMSPDIDPDLFRRQAEAIGKLPQPFLIFTSREDRALGLAALLSGRKPRLGVVQTPDDVAGLDVQVVDFSELADGTGLNHSIPVTSPEAIALLKRLIGQSDAGEVLGRYMVLHRPVQ